MTGSDRPYTFDRVVRLALSAAVLVALFALLRYLSDVLIPFAAAVILAYLLNPVVTAFEAKTRSRGLAVALSLVLLAILGTVLLVLIVPLTIGQFSRFRDDLQELRDDLAVPAASAVQQATEEPAPADTADNSDDGGSTNGPEGRNSERTTIGWLELREAWALYHEKANTLSRAERFQLLRDKLSGTLIGNAVERGIAYIHSAEFSALLVATAKRVIKGGWTVVAFAVNSVIALTGLVIVLLYLVFLLLDFPEYARNWPTFMPPQYRHTIVEFFDQFNIAMRRYFRGQSLIAIMMGVLFAIGFSLIGLPMAIPMGLFVGLLNMVPYLQTVGLIPAMLLAGLRAVEGNSSFLVSVLLTLAVFAVAQLIQDSLITPRIMGKATGLRPVAILLGLFIWGKLLGFLGVLLAIPLTCLGIAYYRRFILQQSLEESRLTDS